MHDIVCIILYGVCVSAHVCSCSVAAARQKELDRVYMNELALYEKALVDMPRRTAQYEVDLESWKSRAKVQHAVLGAYYDCWGGGYYETDRTVTFKEDGTWLVHESTSTDDGAGDSTSDERGTWVAIDDETVDIQEDKKPWEKGPGKSFTFKVGQKFQDVTISGKCRGSRM